MQTGFEFEAAKPKKQADPDNAPSTAPMKPLGGIRRNQTTTDERKVKRQIHMQRRTAGFRDDVNPYMVDPPLDDRWDQAGPWDSDFDKVTKALEDGGWIHTESDGFQWIDDNAPADLVRLYNELAQSGYANGFMASRKVADQPIELGNGDEMDGANTNIRGNDAVDPNTRTMDMLGAKVAFDGDLDWIMSDDQGSGGWPGAYDDGYVDGWYAGHKGDGKPQPNPNNPGSYNRGIEDGYADGQAGRKPKIMTEDLERVLGSRKESNVDTLDSLHKREAEILAAMPKVTLAQQQELSYELDGLRERRAALIQQERDVDFARMVVRDTITPVATHTLHTASTDWLDKIALDDPSERDMANRMHAEARVWFEGVHQAVIQDGDEFTEQALGMARRSASGYRDRDAAENYFLEAAAHYRKQALKVVQAAYGDDFPPVGTKRRVRLPYSEVCMSMRVAGKEMLSEYVGNGMVQLLNDDGSPFSFPITYGEAGWYQSENFVASRKTANLDPEDIPDDYPVRPLQPGENPPGKTTCGTCGLSWDDDIITGMTPAPSARCPFEYFHSDDSGPDWGDPDKYIPEFGMSGSLRSANPKGDEWLFEAADNLNQYGQDHRDLKKKLLSGEITQAEYDKARSESKDRLLGRTAAEGDTITDGTPIADDSGQATSPLPTPEHDRTPFDTMTLPEFTTRGDTENPASAGPLTRMSQRRTASDPDYVIVGGPDDWSFPADPSLPAMGWESRKAWAEGLGVTEPVEDWVLSSIWSSGKDDIVTAEDLRREIQRRTVSPSGRTSAYNPFAPCPECSGTVSEHARGCPASGPKSSGAPGGGIPLRGDLTPEQEAWMKRRSSRRTAQVFIKRDGEIMATVPTVNEAFAWLLNNQGQSVDHAIRFEGWSVEDADGNDAFSGYGRQSSRKTANDGNQYGGEESWDTGEVELWIANDQGLYSMFAGREPDVDELKEVCSDIEGIDPNNVNWEAVAQFCVEASRRRPVIASLLKKASEDLNVGTRVRIWGGFEDGLTGVITSIDANGDGWHAYNPVSGQIEVTPRPGVARYTVKYDGTDTEVEGFHAINLEKIGSMRRRASDPIADPSGQGVSGLPQVPTLGNDPEPAFDDASFDGSVGEGAANVAGVPTPGSSEADYPQPKAGSLEAKRAAFRALIQGNRSRLPFAEAATPKTAEKYEPQPPPAPAYLNGDFMGGWDSWDPWGSGMIWLGAIADVLQILDSGSIPSEWGYRPAMGFGSNGEDDLAHDEESGENYEQSMILDAIKGGHVTTAELAAWGAELDKYLDQVRADGRDY